MDHQTQQALKCNGCGYPMDESMAPGRDDAYDAELWICHSCAAGESAEAAHRRDGGSMHGVRTRVFERRPEDLLNLELLD